MRRSLAGFPLHVVGSDAITDRAVHKLLHGKAAISLVDLHPVPRPLRFATSTDLTRPTIDLSSDVTAAHHLADDFIGANVPFLWLTNAGSIARLQYLPWLLKRFNEGMLLEHVRRLVRGALGRRPTWVRFGESATHFPLQYCRNRSS